MYPAIRIAVVGVMVVEAHAATTTVVVAVAADIQAVGVMAEPLVAVALRVATAVVAVAPV